MTTAMMKKLPEAINNAVADKVAEGLINNETVQKMIEGQIAESMTELSKGITHAQHTMPFKSMIFDPKYHHDMSGHREKPTFLSNEHMRDIALKNVVVASILQTRINQVGEFARPQLDEYSMGFKIVPMDDPTRELTATEKEEAAYITKFILNTGEERDRKRDSFSKFLKKYVRDSLTLDASPYEIVNTYGGKPYAFQAVDGATIKLASYATDEDRERDAEMGEEVSFVQVIDGMTVTQYTLDEMSYPIRNPRTDINARGYGFSELEMLVTTITSHLWAEEYNRRYFSQGSSSKGMINITGDISPEHLESFKRQWLAQASGVSNAWKTPILNSENIQWIPLNQTSRDMEYGGWLEYLVKTACAVYQIDPAEINFDIRSGTAQAPLFESSNEAKEKLSRDKGLKPLLRGIEDDLNTNIIWRINENYCLVFVGLDAKTPEQALDMDIRRMQNFETVDEVRVKNKKPPLGGLVGGLPANPILLQAKMAEMQGQAPDQQPQGSDSFYDMMNQGGHPSLQQAKEEEQPVQPTGSPEEILQQSLAMMRKPDGYEEITFENY